jgi:ABC-2 type transport system permease protein
MILAPLRAELTKLIKRRRTWLGFAFFAVLELVMPAMFYLPKVSATFRELIEKPWSFLRRVFLRPHTRAPDHAHDGFFVATLFLALIAGDIVAKETEEGTIRMVLSRRVGRFTVIAAKYVSAAAFT